MLHTLELTNFRSYQSGLFGFEPSVNIIVGPNASGKTNLLEAIHVIATAQGFRGNDKTFITHSEEWSRLEAMTESGQRVVKLQQEKSPSLEIENIVIKRIKPTQDTLPVVVFEPEHMLLLNTESERRRAYLDTILSMSFPSYKKELRACKRALAQRNKLLKQLNIANDQLFVWDVNFAQKAGAVARMRSQLVSELHAVGQKHYQAISQSSDTLRFSYQSKLSLENYTDHLLDYLKKNIETDRSRGFTTAGPHRDDVYIELNGVDARYSASRGETRSIILAMKIFELERVHEQREAAPILLLDDVFSELDGTRRRALAERLVAYQTFLTTTDADVAVDHFSNYNIIPMG